MLRPIYLDHHATTPVDKRVLKSMLPYFNEKFGNSSSIDHIYGNESLSAVNEARKQVSDLINAEPEEIIFTSGATESDNLAIFGTAHQQKEKGNHIITCITEHKAILDSCKKLESEGFDVSYLKVDQKGIFNLDELDKLITPKTILISLMAANNEIGTIAPLKKIGEIAHKHGVIFHTDAAQAVGHISINVEEMKIDLMSISGHKIYGPKGVGALYVRRKDPHVKLIPLVFGGGHEKGLRPGTLNVPAIVGLGEASRLAKEEMVGANKRLKKLTQKLYLGITSAIKVEINGSTEDRLSHNLNLYFEGIDAKALINEVKDVVAISAGSACNSDDVTPSHVILALGYDKDRAYSSVRFGLGNSTTEGDIEKTIEVITKAVDKLKNL
jgi:cysteine desulfurase